MKYSRSDANQKEIVAVLRKIGYSVLVLSSVAKGADLLIGAKGQNWLIELKNKESYAKKATADKMKTPGQKDFHLLWQGQIATCYTLEDVLKVLREG